jgi:hypothetical protein
VCLVVEKARPKQGKKVWGLKLLSLVICAGVPHAFGSVLADVNTHFPAISDM